MKKIIRFLLLAVLSAFLSSAAAQTRPAFQDYPAEIYTGKIHIPKGLYKEQREKFKEIFGEIRWRNEEGKRVWSPEINFAGKYFVFGNSCGQGCRYYRMTDLSTGKDVDNNIDTFNTSIDAKLKDLRIKTKDGRMCVASPETWPDSRLMKITCEAYWPVYTKKGEEIYTCEERYYLLDNKENLRPVTNRRYKCRK